jgi:hypothetical protein
MKSMLRRWRERVALRILVSVLTLTLAMIPAAAVAQNLGQQPATGQAVQGQQAATPEGTFLNFVNWVGNVICPIAAGLALVGSIINWRQGRNYAGWLATAGGLLMVSGGLRFIEFLIQNAQAVG